MWPDFKTGSYQSAKKAGKHISNLSEQSKTRLEHAPANYTPTNQQTHQLTE